MLQIHEVNLAIYPCTCKYMCIDNRLHKMISYFNTCIHIVYTIFEMKKKTRILIITFYIPLQIYKHSFFSWFINEKKETYSDNLYVIFWKFILTLIYSFSENNICKASMTFISASSEMSRNVCSGKHCQMQV